MTSRFGKTYNRKGGEANSKFEEVFSNKKPTLTTKWGETTYKAQLGAKRPSLKSEAAELPKRPRLELSDRDEDPFGFDSDDESKTVTSQTVAQSKSEDGNAATTTKPASALVAGTKAPSGSMVTSAAKQTCEVQVVKNSQSWCRTTASNSTQKPATAAFSSTSRDPNSMAASSLSMDATQMLPGGSQGSQFTSTTSQDGLSSERAANTEKEPPAEPVKNVEPSPFTLRPANSRKYQRPGRDTASSTDGDKAPEAPCTDAKPANTATVGTSVGKTAANANAAAVAANAAKAAPAAGRGRGRVRDYTVLHPSCLSVCNVTIQDTIERSMDELVAPAAPADLGDAGLMKKKSDIPQAKTRFRPTKTKKETKLEFFGFEDKEDHGGEEGSEGGAAAGGGGSSSYKIKYFGFDDLSESESDSDEESSQAKEKTKAKKAAAAAAAALAALGTSVDSPQTSDSQDSQTSSNTDGYDLAEDSGPGACEGPKGRSGKQNDKSKDLTTGFKKIFSGPKKTPAKASYNARHWNQPEPEEIPPPLARAHTAPASLSSSGSSSKDSNSSHKDDGLFKTPPPPPKVIKSETLPTRLHQDIVTALKCRKEHKELYTVVQHVKHFNDVVEFGENQEFTDDFEYLETGLKSSQPLNTRCLSIISLATRCAMPSFRMHLRARGKVAQVFKMISDAPQHPNLALCTAALMYILSRDRLNMDLDRACLELMIKLLELELEQEQVTPEPPGVPQPAPQDQLTAKEVAKVKEKIRKLCETVHNKHLDLENITTGHLAMETLLSLTSKRAGDWFKEELRLLGGLDHIVDKVKECVENLSEEEDKEKLVASLWGAERCLRVLESVTLQNPENQGYLIAYKDSQLIISSARGLRCCEDMIQRYSRALGPASECSGSASKGSGPAPEGSASKGSGPAPEGSASKGTGSASEPAAASELHHCSSSNVGKAVEDCMRAVIGVLLNLTHDNEWGSTKTGEQDEFIVTALNCVLRAPRYIPLEQRFDVRVLGLGLLINLVEYSSRNRHCLVDMDYTLAEGCLDDSSLAPPTDPTAAPGQQQGEEPAAPPCSGEPPADDEPSAAVTGALAALVKLFLERERAAILAEAKTDDVISEAPKPALDQSGEWKETPGEIQWVAAETKEGAESQEPEKKEEEDEELDLNKALQHAGKHMEDSIAASYTALLLGCLCQGSQLNVTTVREHLPNGDFSIMTEMLKKFLNFMNLTCSVGTTGQKSISRVIEYLEQC